MAARIPSGYHWSPYTMARPDHSRGRLALAGSLTALLPTMFCTLAAWHTGQPSPCSRESSGSPHDSDLRVHAVILAYESALIDRG
jgi:hypothetical protein